MRGVNVDKGFAAALAVVLVIAVLSVMLIFSPSTLGLGGSNIFSDAKVKYPKVSSESVIARNPEIIIIKTGYMGEVAREESV
ncbi:MAG: hypothetical protein ACXQTQ_01385 [Candidatus Hecatellaceae archaeon]